MAKRNQPPNASRISKAKAPRKADPRDLAEFQEFQQRVKDNLSHRNITISGLPPVPDDFHLADDEPLAILEPFGVNADMLSKLDWLLTISDVRKVVDDPAETGPWLGKKYRETLKTALEKAERWEDREDNNTTP